MVQVKKLLALNTKAFRKKLGVSQEKLAEVTALSAQSISDIEGCRTWVSDKTLEKLAKAFNIDIFQLFIPPNDNNDAGLSFYNQLRKLRTSMKEDIDKRLDQFYITKKSFAK